MLKYLTTFTLIGNQTYIGKGTGKGIGIIFLCVFSSVNSVKSGLNFLRIFLAFSFLKACASLTCVPRMRNISRTTILSKNMLRLRSFE